VASFSRITLSQCVCIWCTLTCTLDVGPYLSDKYYFYYHFNGNGVASIVSCLTVRGEGQQFLAGWKGRFSTASHRPNRKRFTASLDSTVKANGASRTCRSISWSVCILILSCTPNLSASKSHLLLDQTVRNHLSGVQVVQRNQPRCLVPVKC